jgi:hypothetical protein
MSVCGASPAASACNACARPISPPSAVTAALLDMFCGLNGATSIPRARAARASPATSIDLPTLEPVPWIITARPMAVPSGSIGPVWHGRRPRKAPLWTCAAPCPKVASDGYDMVIKGGRVATAEAVFTADIAIAGRPDRGARERT